jgi:hypothetical protein
VREEENRKQKTENRKQESELESHAIFVGEFREEA